MYATRLSKFETMEILVTRIAVESKIYYPSIKNTCICYKNCPMGYCQILQATCKAGAKGSYKLQSPSEVLSLAFNECKFHLPKCLLYCVCRRRPWAWHWPVQAAQYKWGKHLINTSWALIFLKIVLYSDSVFFLLALNCSKQRYRRF